MESKSALRSVPAPSQPSSFDRVDSRGRRRGLSPRTLTRYLIPAGRSCISTAAANKGAPESDWAPPLDRPRPRLQPAAAAAAARWRLRHCGRSTSRVVAAFRAVPLAPPTRSPAQVKAPSRMRRTTRIGRTRPGRPAANGACSSLRDSGRSAPAATIAPSAMAGRGGGAPERLEQDASYCVLQPPGPPSRSVRAPPPPQRHRPGLGDRVSLVARRTRNHGCISRGAPHSNFESELSELCSTSISRRSLPAK
jgi:hypothetical protein